MEFQVFRCYLGQACLSWGAQMCTAQPKPARHACSHKCQRDCVGEICDLRDAGSLHSPAHRGAQLLPGKARAHIRPTMRVSEY